MKDLYFVFELKYLTLQSFHFDLSNIFFQKALDHYLKYFLIHQTSTHNTFLLFLHCPHRKQIQENYLLI